MSTLLVYVQSQGIAMGSKHGGRMIGWTTNPEAAQNAREHGATVITGYNATGPAGWEISFSPETEEVIQA